MDFAKILPMAFVMVAGPQIISAFFFATSESWRRLSAAYVAGAAISITAIVSAAYLFAQGASGDGGNGDSGLSTLDYVVLALLVFAAIHTFRNRNQSEPPKWMGRLQEATPRTSLVLGFLLLGFFPSDIVTSVTVGSFLGDRGDSWWEVLPFVGLTLLLLASPALAVGMLGQHAQAALPRLRNWMNANSWVISEAVILFFIVIVLTG